VNNTALSRHLQALRAPQDDWHTQLLLPAAATTEPSWLNYVDTEDELVCLIIFINKRVAVSLRPDEAAVMILQRNICLILHLFCRITLYSFSIKQIILKNTLI